MRDFSIGIIVILTLPIWSPLVLMFMFMFIVYQLISAIGFLCRTGKSPWEAY